MEISFRYEHEDDIYFASSDGARQYFYSRMQALRAYRGSLRRRADRLAVVYSLNKLAFAAGDLVIDCGANVGDVYLYFKFHDHGVRYIGIEPSPSEHACLSRNVAPSVTHNLGLWNADGEIDFYVSSGQADSSFIEPPSYDEIRRVPARRLDGLVTGPVKLLKVEAEGGEPEVLEGAERLLPSVQFISADLGYERGPSQSNTLVPVVNFLLARGFVLLNVTPGRMVALFENRNLRAP